MKLNTMSTSSPSGAKDTQFVQQPRLWDAFRVGAVLGSSALGGQVSNKGPAVKLVELHTLLMAFTKFYV